jgi:hypothetical protein
MYVHTRFPPNFLRTYFNIQYLSSFLRHKFSIPALEMQSGLCSAKLLLLSTPPFSSRESGDHKNPPLLSSDVPPMIYICNFAKYTAILCTCSKRWVLRFLSHRRAFFSDASQHSHFEIMYIQHV